MGRLDLLVGCLALALIFAGVLPTAALVGVIVGGIALASPHLRRPDRGSAGARAGRDPAPSSGADVEGEPL
jgi:hypothetical protein